jgi:adenine phosphoribosyltransferase
LEVHADAFHKGQRVLLVDDLLATGGTMVACCQLAQQLGANIVGIAVLIELTFLPGRQRLQPFGDVHSVIRY